MKKLNTTFVYIFSILGFLCCCLGIGWILSLVGFLKANSELKKAQDNHEEYINIGAMKTAKTVALISLIISGLIGLYVIYIVIMIFTNPEFACDFWTNALSNVENNPGMNEEGLKFYRQMQEEACSKL